MYILTLAFGIYITGIYSAILFSALWPPSRSLPSQLAVAVAVFWYCVMCSMFIRACFSLQCHLKPELAGWAFSSRQLAGCPLNPHEKSHLASGGCSRGCGGWGLGRGGCSRSRFRQAALRHNGCQGTTSFILASRGDIRRITVNDTTRGRIRVDSRLVFWSDR